MHKLGQTCTYVQKLWLPPQLKVKMLTKDMNIISYLAAF